MTDLSPKIKSSVFWLASALTAIVLVLIVFFGIYYNNKKTGPILVPTPTSNIINVEGGELPENLPKDIVLEKDVRVLQSYYTKPFPYNKELTLYQIQSSFSFVSKKGLDENFTSYNEYLKDNGWQITGSIDKKDIKRLTAIRGPDRLSVSINISPLSKETTVGLFNIRVGLYSELNKAQVK